jgi:hypothetical protein
MVVRALKASAGFAQMPTQRRRDGGTLSDAYEVHRCEHRPAAGTANEKAAKGKRPAIKL